MIRISILYAAYVAEVRAQTEWIKNNDTTTPKRNVTTTGLLCTRSSLLKLWSITCEASL